MGPCQYPNCKDKDGSPHLTQETFCDACQRRYRKLIDWLVLDWVLLRTDLPKPVVIGDATSATPSKSKTFGHPAEWASVTSAEIADALNWAEDALREYQGHEPPPHPGVRESGRVAHAYRYLTDQFTAACDFDAAVDTAVDFYDLHRKVRRALGYTRIVQWLPTPCPWCDTAALVRDIGRVECRECGKVVDEKHYGWFAGWIVDQLIEDYDTLKAAELA